MEKYIKIDDKKSKQVEDIVKQIAKDNNKEYEIKNVNPLLWNFCNSKIGQNIKNLDKEAIKNAARDYCNEKSMRMEKRMFTPYAREYYSFIELFGFDEEFKNKIRNSINKFLEATRGIN